VLYAIWIPIGCGVGVNGQEARTVTGRTQTGSNKRQVVSRHRMRWCSVGRVERKTCVEGSNNREYATSGRFQRGRLLNMCAQSSATSTCKSSQCRYSVLVAVDRADCSVVRSHETWCMCAALQSRHGRLVSLRRHVGFMFPPRSPSRASAGPNSKNEHHSHHKTRTELLSTQGRYLTLHAEK